LRALLTTVRLTQGVVPSQRPIVQADKVQADKVQADKVQTDKVQADKVQTDVCQGERSGGHDETGPKVEVVGEAVNGREAVRLVEECRPDVVLMDARMPVMDGLQATRLIKDRWPGVRIVVLTVYAARRSEALAAGADVFLVKGCPTEELLQAILNPAEPHPSID
jgi:CheY-like chemotaxis protein